MQRSRYYPERTMYHHRSRNERSAKCNRTVSSTTENRHMQGSSRVRLPFCGPGMGLCSVP
jgi:hypothetical protein